MKTFRFTRDFEEYKRGDIIDFSDDSVPTMTILVEKASLFERIDQIPETLNDIYSLRQDTQIQSKAKNVYTVLDAYNGYLNTIDQDEIPHKFTQKDVDYLKKHGGWRILRR